MTKKQKTKIKEKIAEIKATSETIKKSVIFR